MAEYIPETKEELLKLINNPKNFLSGIKTYKITDMSSLFEHIEMDDWSGIEQWNVSNVKDMCATFACSNFNGNISNWNVSNVKNIKNMFKDSNYNQKTPSYKISKKIGMTF